MLSGPWRRTATAACALPRAPTPPLARSIDRFPPESRKHTFAHPTLTRVVPMTQLRPLLARLALRRAALAAHQQEAMQQTNPGFAALGGLLSARLMSTASAGTSELKDALKAKIPAEQVRE